MSEIERFKSLIEEFFREEDRLYPTTTTILGIHNYDDCLEDFSSSGLSKQKKIFNDYLAKFKALDYGALDTDSRVEYLLVTTGIRRALRILERTRDWQTDPNFYLDIAIQSLYMLLIREFAPLEERVKSIVSRLKLVPVLLKQGKENLENPPEIFTGVAIETADGAVHFLESTIMPLAEEVPSLKNDLIGSTERVINAFKDFREFLEKDLLPRSKGNFAAGPEIFDEMLREDHFLDFNHQQLWKTGQEIFAQSLEALKEGAAKIDKNKNWFDIMLDIKKKYPSAGELLKAYMDYMKKAKDFVIEKNLVDIPAGEEIEIIDTPIFNRPQIPFAAYMPPGPFDKVQKAHFWVTPIDLNLPPETQGRILQEHAWAKIQYVALHEAYPGHHLQLVYMSTLPSNVLKRSFSTVLVEGWAFYCEEMMKDLGFLDEYGGFSQLDAQLWRAARVIIDAGLHTRGLSFTEAVKFLEEKVHMARPSAVAEVKRYTRTPTQPMSYFIGKLEILKLRREFKEKMGEKYSLKDFHQKLLNNGSVPPALSRIRLGLGEMKPLEKILL